MNGEDVYGRKITVCLPDETPFYNTVRKFSVSVNKRNESPSPHRNFGRQRTHSRSYTPEKDVRNVTNTKHDHFLFDQYGNKQQSSLLGSDNKCVTGVQNYSANLFQSTGSPSSSNTHVDNQGSTTPHCQEEGNSPGSNLHALPNSNSDRFYQKSVVTDITKEMENISVNPTSSSSNPANSHTYEMSDLSQAGSTGKSIVVFKSSVKSLADIPTPSFGFRDMPPPSLPNISSNNTLGPSLDPIKLIESASKDKMGYGQTGKSNFKPPNHQLDDQAYSNQASSDHSSKQSEFHPTIHHNNSMGKSQYPLQHQRGSSALNSLAPGSLSSEGQSSEDTLCMAHGYPPASSYHHSDKQNSQTFKRPQTPKKGQSVTSLYSNQAKPMGAKHQTSSVSPVFCVPSSSDHRPTSPFTNLTKDRPRPKQPGCHLYRVPTPENIGDPEMDYSSPEFNSARDHHVELIVSNLDYNIHPREWRKILYATFQPHVLVLSIQIRLQADNTSMATICLPTEQDARFAISQFHRRKIGYKRINVQFKSDGSSFPADNLRADTISLLMEAKDHKLALSRIIDLFDKRYHKAVSVSDIYKMRDVLQIQEISGAGRWVKLQPGVKRSPTPIHNMETDTPEVLEQPLCQMHCQEGSSFHTEALNSCMLPNVTIMRKHFSPQLHSLLLSHNGYVPLMSFPACYAAEFYPLMSVKEGGIPMEHIIACVPGVEIAVSKTGVKVIQFQENREPFYDMMKGTSWQELGKISREVMDLLRQQPTCSMPVSKFIPSYHHYFGRQCRVADYGYTKLQELFEAIPHAIQMLGTGDRKVITLSPRAQLKRFTSDILKVVKSQPAKQILLQEFPYCFEKVMGHPLYLPHYGISYIEDVLSDIPTTTLIVIEEGKHTLLAVPRRDQTPEEVERTKQFALEVVDLLKHHPQCRMAFNKFIPAYHHHLGRQCRVAAYGFNKLTDLFEAISHVVEIEEEGEERILHLSSPELRKVLCEQLSVLIRPVGCIPINKLLSEYAKHFGFGLKLEDFGVDTVHALIKKMKTHLRMEVSNDQEFVCLVREVHIPVLGLQVMQLLMDESGGSLPLMELCMRYESLFGTACNVKQIKEELQDFLQIDDTDGDAGGNIRLTSHQLLGRNFRLLLLHHKEISMCDLTSIYRQQFGVELSPALYGFQTLYQLLHSFPHILQVRGKSTQKYLVLSGMLATPGILPPARVDVTSPNSFTTHSSFNHNVHLKKLTMTSNDTEQKMKLPSRPYVSSSPVSSPSQLLQHASLQWDPSLALQPSHTLSVLGPLINVSNNASPAKSSNNLMDDGLISRNSATCQLETVTQSNDIEISSTAIPPAWTMKEGNHMTSTSLVSYNKPGFTTGMKMENLASQELSEVNDDTKNCMASSSISGNLADSSSRDNTKADSMSIKADDSKEDIFLSGELPLDTSSTHSLLNSSSQSSNSSPIKRRPRIAANFSQAQ